MMKILFYRQVRLKKIGWQNEYYMRMCLTKSVMPRYIIDATVYIKVPQNHLMKTITFHKKKLCSDEKSF